jgi:drug/metabolite transporter (DMT)-like permease
MSATDPQQRRAGLTLMLAAVVAFAAMSALVKTLREHGMSTTETMFYRMAPGLPWLWLELRLRGEPLRAKRPLLTTLRAAFGGLAMAGGFFSLQGLTLLQGTLLHLTQPVFVAGLAPAFLGERLRGTALIALGLALGGAVLAIWPDDANGLLDVPVLFGGIGLAAALASAFAHVSVRMATTPRAGIQRGFVRRLTRSEEPERPETIVFHFTLHLSVAALLIGLLLGDFRRLPHDLPALHTWGIIAAMALFGAAGQLLMSRAYARAPAPVVAVVGYAAIPLGVLADAALWRTLPGTGAIIGSAAMVAAGALIARRPRHP